MRQGQQNRRGRGRNRKSQNPMTRTYESAGPDVKIRGTAAHVAEKYMSLARDAMSSGDPVLAENYLQHAEHYNRIIMAFREQQIGQGGGDPMAGGRMRPEGGMDGGDDYGDDEGDDAGYDGSQGFINGGEPQPQQNNQPRSYEGQPRFDNRQHRNDHHRNGHQRFDRGDRGDHRNGGDHRQDFRRHDNRGEGRQDFRHDRQDRSDRQERGDRDRGDRNFDRNSNDRQDRNYDRGGDRQDRSFTPRNSSSEPPVVPREESPVVVQAPAIEAGNEAVQQPRRRERFQAQQHEQPEFLRRPVRRPRREAAASESDTPASTPPAGDDSE